MTSQPTAEQDTLPISCAALAEIQATAGSAAMLEELAASLRLAGRLHDLFDVRLMQRRLALGLPAVLDRAAEDLPTPQREALEDGYLAACREVGHLLLAAGDPRSAWMYLRPVGDKADVAHALAGIEPAPEQVDGLIELALHQGVSPALGVRWMLSNYGTCNTISTIDAQLGHWTAAERSAAVTCLVTHLHHELTENVRQDIARREGALPAATTLEELVSDRAWLFDNDNYHLDTSHLHATVRFARLLEDRHAVRLAHDLTTYGRRLSAHYQYPGEEPFADSYPAHSLFFAAQLGQRVEEAIAYFGSRARDPQLSQQSTAPAEVYVLLLARLGRFSEALSASGELLPTGAGNTGLAPSVHELATRGGLLGTLVEMCRRREDVLGFAAALAQASLDSPLPTAPRS